MANLKKRIIAFLDKEGFDYTQGPVDPYKFHTTFIFFARLFSVMDDKVKPWWMYASPVVAAINGVAAVIIITYALVIYIPQGEINAITECGTYWLVMVYKLVIVSCYFLGREHYSEFLKALRADFKYIATRGQKYSKGFFENQKLTFKACYLSGVFTGFIGGGMIFSSFLAWGYVMIAYDKGHQRPLPFPFLWYGHDVHDSPYYEMMFFLCVWFTFSHTYIYIFMVQSQVIWVRQITCKADLIVWSIQDLLIDVKPAENKKEEVYYNYLIKHRMQEIMIMHHNMIKLLEHYASVFKKCLLVEQKFSSPIICMTAYCAAEKLDDGEIPLILILLCSAVIILVLIPSYLSTFLAEKVQSVSYACWDMPFWNAGPVIRPYAVLMMQRSMRSLPIQAAGFEDISLQTYFALITRAYSGFNMLRQANFDF